VLSESGFRFCAWSITLADCVIYPGDAKTKVWGSSNQYDIQINLRRMEQFVLVNLCCHSWLEPGEARGI